MLPSSLIPRSATYPGMLSSHTRARRGSWPWMGTVAEGSGKRARSSRSLFMLLAALYAFALLLIPFIYACSSSIFRPHTAGLDTISDSSAAPGHSLSRLAAFGSRRLALQRGSNGGGATGLIAHHSVLQAAAASDAAVQRAQAAVQQAQAQPLWPDTGLAQLNYGAKTAGLPRVEYRDAGHVVLLQDALNASRWNEQPLYQASPVPHPVLPSGAKSLSQGTHGGGGSSSDTGSSAAKFPPSCPQGDVRLFIGITSRCCMAEAQAKRMALRRTWVQYARDHHPNVQLRFILAQPVDDRDVIAAVGLLKSEIEQYADIIVVPGQELYRYLPNKTLQLLRYALSSDCKFTHYMKTDDDVYIRPQRLLDIITTGQYNFSLPVQYDGSGWFDGQKPTYFQSPWMSGMYVGALDSNKSGVFPGWQPARRPDSKWYLSEADLPDELAPLGVRWVSGWGYILSRDLAEFITNTALMYAAVPSKKPSWWGRMPWEDIMVGAMLRDVAKVHHHDGFKAAWHECDPRTVVKHLDNDAPALQEGLHAQELNGLWARKSVVCSSGIFEVNKYDEWRAWRNSLPDNQIGGFM